MEYYLAIKNEILPFVTAWMDLKSPDVKHKAHAPNLALHLVLSSPAPCFYPAAAPSSRLTVKESLHVYSPKMTFGPLKATARLMWPSVQMSLTPLL